MHTRLFTYGPRLVAYGFLAALGILFGCGGNAGVDNGTIVGRVLSDASSVSATQTPLSNATVVIRRQGVAQAVIRRTLTDANGQFVFGDVPVGPYTIGYSRDGFIPIDPIAATSMTQTNKAGQDLFVEPAQTVVVPDVTLQTNRQTGTANVVLTILDSITGNPVTNATVTVGVVTTADGGNNGVYTLAVPLQPKDNEAANSPFSSGAKQVTIQTDGFQTVIDTLGLVANATIAKTYFLDPLRVSVEGTIRISKFQGVFDITQVVIKVTDAAVAVVGPNAQGVFEIQGIPASNSQFTRTFNLRFTQPDLQTFVLSNFVAPRSGERTVPLVITMDPLVVDVTGSVIDSSGNLPNSGLGLDTAGILETGQTATVVNGAFTIPAVPVRNLTGDIGFTLRVRAFNPTAPNPNPPPATGREEGVDVTIRPLSDGTPGAVFVVPLVKTNAL